MALRKIESKELVPHKPSEYKAGQKRKKILNEDSYVKNIEEIIERDFFPDLPTLKSEAEYEDALQRNDLVKLRELQMKRGLQRPTTGQTSICSSPATFETPDPRPSHTSPKVSSAEGADSAAGEDTEVIEENEKSAKGLSLDQFLAKNTSEDNASFSEILEETQRKHREKHAWLYEKVQHQDEEQVRKMILPSIEEQAALPSTQPAPDTWTYQAKNSLMYVPEGVELSQKELIEEQKHKPRQICHENTRFRARPFNFSRQAQLLHQAASDKAQANLGKIGPDGREVITAPSPSVNGYGFLHTPSPAPGVEDSPLMTWGEVEGTPLRLEPGATPGPVFKIPDLPKREKLAMKLAEDASKVHRAKKKEALRQVSRSLASPSPKLRRSTAERLNSMSPAAQLLANKRLGIKIRGDKALRESYSPSPSPSHRLPGNKTPVIPGVATPPTPQWLAETPPSAAQSPATTPRAGSSTPRQDPPASPASLTDNLLQLPKRPRAADFF